MLVVYFNRDFVTGLEIAVNCFVTLLLEQLVPRADRTDPVLANSNLRWHSLDRRSRNHLSNGLHRILDLASSTHCRKAEANDGYRYEVAYSVHNYSSVRNSPSISAYNTHAFKVRFQAAGWIYVVGRIPKKPHAKPKRAKNDSRATGNSMRLTPR